MLFSPLINHLCRYWKKNMDAIWEQLSRPLPPVGLDARKVVTPELRRQLAARLANCEFEYRSEGRANIVFGIRDAGADAGADASPKSAGWATVQHLYTTVHCAGTGAVQGFQLQERE